MMSPEISRTGLCERNAWQGRFVECMVVYPTMYIQENNAQSTP